MAARARTTNRQSFSKTRTISKLRMRASPPIRAISSIAGRTRISELSTTRTLRKSARRNRANEKERLRQDTFPSQALFLVRLLQYRLAHCVSDFQQPSRFPVGRLRGCATLMIYISARVNDRLKRNYPCEQRNRASAAGASEKTATIKYTISREGYTGTREAKKRYPGKLGLFEDRVLFYVPVAFLWVYRNLC